MNWNEQFIPCLSAWTHWNFRNEDVRPREVTWRRKAAISHKAQTSLSTGEWCRSHFFTRWVVCISNESDRNVSLCVQYKCWEWLRQRACMETERKPRAASCAAKLSVRSILFTILLSLSFFVLSLILALIFLRFLYLFPFFLFNVFSVIHLIFLPLLLSLSFINSFCNLVNRRKSAYVGRLNKHEAINTN